MASLYEIIDVLVEHEYTDESEQVQAVVKDLTENPGSYIISNDVIFYALHHCGYLKTVLYAIRNTGKPYGESPVIQKQLTRLKSEYETIANVRDQMDFLCSMMEIMENVRLHNLRVSNASLKYAHTHFSEFADFIDTLKENNADFPVYNFTDEEKSDQE